MFGPDCQISIEESAGITTVAELEIICVLSLIISFIWNEVC